MATRMRDAMMGRLTELRYEPTEKRVRARLDGEVVVDTRSALLVWEPRRVVPSYAVPVEDVRAELLPGPPAAAAPDRPILHPGIPFAAHSCEGEALSLRAGAATRDGAGFRPAAAELAGHVVLDHDAFDAWYEEDEALVGHPRDPYHRIDIRRSARHVRIEADGELLAESGRPTLVFETHLPVRFYLPREDVRLALRPSPKTTVCPYKGEASYWTPERDGRSWADVAWSYETPLEDASALAGLVAFFDERVDVVADAERREPPDTAFARAIRDEFAA